MNKHCHSTMFYLLRLTRFSLSLALLLSCYTATATETKSLFLMPFSEHQLGTNKQLLETSFSQAIGKDVRIVGSDFWYQYQTNIKKGSADIVFSQAHYSAWLVHQKAYTPILKLAGKLHYLLISKRTQSEIYEYSDLANTSVCAQPAFSFEYLLIEQLFANAWSRPNIEKTDLLTWLQSETATPCPAYLINLRVFESLPDSLQNRHSKLFRSRATNQFAITVSPGINKGNQAKLQALITSQKIADILNPLLEKIMGTARWEPASIEDYPKHEAAKLNTVWAAAP